MIYDSGCSSVSAPIEQGFDLRRWPERLDYPLRWRRSRRIFVNSMSDLFHRDVPDDFIMRVFGVMAQTPHHTFQVLTKRPSRLAHLVPHITERLREYRECAEIWPDHIWLDVSTEIPPTPNRANDSAANGESGANC